MTHAEYYKEQGLEPRGCVVRRDDYKRVTYYFSDGSLLVEQDAERLAYMGDPAHPECWQDFVLCGGRQEHWRYDPRNRAWSGTIPVEVPAEDVVDIVDSDWDESVAYVGDGEDGCYINVGQGPGGWYVSVSLDCNSGGFTHEMCEDDGPYESYEEALASGRDVATTWCCDNDVYYDDDRLDGITVGTPIWVKPHHRAMDQAVRATVLEWDQDNDEARVRYGDGREEDIPTALVRGIDYDATTDWRDQEQFD